MMTLFAAALAAAAHPPAPAQSADAHAQHQQMGQMKPGQMGEKKPGMMAEMKDCCCKDMMSKMHHGEGKEHGDPKGR